MIDPGREHTAVHADWWNSDQAHDRLRHPDMVRRQRRYRGYATLTNAMAVLMFSALLIVVTTLISPVQWTGWPVDGLVAMFMVLVMLAGWQHVVPRSLPCCRCSTVAGARMEGPGVTLYER